MLGILYSRIIKSPFPVNTSEVNSKFSALQFAQLSLQLLASSGLVLADRSRVWPNVVPLRQLGSQLLRTVWATSRVDKSVKDSDVALTERKRTRTRMRMVIMMLMVVTMMMTMMLMVMMVMMVMMAKPPTATNRFLVTVKRAGFKGHLKSCRFRTTCHVQENQKPDGHRLIQW